ncbi:MAG: hypothetical protein QHH24_04850 [Candidatus Bathyarchaeota archaeon]|nr:hypothetical protein [Candidatus Bathyarchaeota archaeon]
MSEACLVFAFGIFKVIYAPHKAFKEIIQNPKYYGPILVLVLFVASNVGLTYVTASKPFSEQTLPKASEFDAWTENSTLWTADANVEVSENNDHINGSYYGNKSIEFSLTNTYHAWMRLSDIGHVNCTGALGFKNMSFRVKLNYPDTTAITNATVLLSSGAANYFQYNMTQALSTAAKTVWNNFTLPLGAGSGWIESGGQPDWGNITVVQFEFALSSSTNMTILMDGLFFRGVYRSPLEKEGDIILAYSAAYSIVQFLVHWILFAVSLLMLARLLGAHGSLRSFTVVIGFVLITMVVQTLANIALYSTLPSIRYPLELFGGPSNEAQVIFNKIAQDIGLVSQLVGIVGLLTFFWTIFLGGIATRQLTEFSWSKSLLIAAAAYMVSILVQGLLLQF